MTNLEKLQNWYIAQTDGDWEHSYGIKIESLDNPAWVLRIDLAETPYENLILDYKLYENSESDWYALQTKNKVFIGTGDPTKLDFLIRKFFKVIDSFNIKRKKIKILDLNRGQLAKYTFTPIDFEEVTSLNLQSNAISDLSISLPNIANFLSLEELYLGGNLLTAVPTEVFQLKNLRILGLDNNLIKHFDCSNFTFPKLENLDLGKNELKSFIFRDSSFPELRKIELLVNDLSIDFFSSGKMPKLLELNLLYNKKIEENFLDLPSNIMETRIDPLYDNAKPIPSKLINFPSLTKIYLANYSKENSKVKEYISNFNRELAKRS